MCGAGDLSYFRRLRGDSQRGVCGVCSRRVELAGDPSLRLKSGSAQDDAANFVKMFASRNFFRFFHRGFLP